MIKHSIFALPIISPIFLATISLSLGSLAADELPSNSSYDVNLTKKAAPVKLTDQQIKRVKWFKDARFGMFVHWGLYSELGGTYNGHTMPDKSLANGNSWYSEWAQMRLEVPKDKYQALAKSFNPTAFNADVWANEAKLAGMKYIILTAKHHDGFALWDSAVSDFDLGATTCKRDILGELVEACRKRNIKIGFYYSHWQDWQHPGGALPPWKDKVQPSDESFEKYWQDKCLPQVKELLTRYHPDLLWFDTWGDKAKGTITPKRRDEMIDLIRKFQPDCLINGRLCAHNTGNQIDFISAGDNQHPEKNLGRPWQTPATMNHTWAWHANDFNWKPKGELIRLLSTNASLGGNYLLNIGPHADGSIPKPSIRRLREIGGWLVAHGESVYGTGTLDDVPAPAWGRLTARQENGKNIVYAHVMDWKTGTLALPKEAGAITSASVLETGEPVKISKDAQSFTKPTGGLHPDDAVIKLILK